MITPLALLLALLAPTPVRLVFLDGGAAITAAERDALITQLEAALPVVVLRDIEHRPLPKAAFYAPRHRYRADALLKFLEPLAPPGGKALGITGVDISTSKDGHVDWGIFGLATLGGPSAVISHFRLRRGHPSPEKRAHRIASTAVHEIGHTLGLPHCPEPGCVMQDAEGSIANTDAGDGRLGPACRAQLKVRED